MNAFTNYEPVLSWRNHDTSTKRALASVLSSQKDSAQIKLPGSLNNKIQMMGIPSRHSINTDTTKQKDRTDMIKRGGR